MFSFLVWLILLHLNGKGSIANGTFVILTCLLMFSCN